MREVWRFAVHVHAWLTFLLLEFKLRFSFCCLVIHPVSTRILFYLECIERKGA